MTHELSSTSTRPLSALCRKCRSLFAQRDKPLEEEIHVVHDETSYSSLSEECHLCLILLKNGETKPPHLTLSYENGKFSLKNREIFDDTEWSLIKMRFFPIAKESNEPTVELGYVDNKREWSVFKVNPEISSDTIVNTACFEQIQRWLEICTQKHRLCRQRHAGDRHAILPTRLIDVRDDPKLIITASHGFNNSTTNYATLTHRWVQRSAAKLLRSNLRRFTQVIDPGFLSPVFQDSISVARRLGLHYIWIDALCIIQDDPEDWNRESTMMGPGVSECVHQRWCKRRSHKTRSTIGFRSEQLRDILRAPRLSEWLIRRDWILQERLLSPRSIYFDKLLIWECPELLANESFPEGPQPEEDRVPVLGYEVPFRLGTLLERSRSKYLAYGNDLRINETYRTWLELVSEYKKCKLSFESDIFPALSGLAQIFNEVLHDEYVAGLWRGDMIRGFLWRSYRRYRFGLSDNLLQEHRAPSWSWASAAAAREVIGFFHEESSKNTADEIFLAKVHDVNVIMATPDPMGQIKDGYIRISGHLRSRQDNGPRIINYSYTEYEVYDYAHEVNGYCPDESTIYFALTLLPKATSDVGEEIDSARVRGLIVEPANRAPDEYRQIGMFNIDPDVRPAFKGLDLKNIQPQVITII